MAAKQSLTSSRMHRLREALRKGLHELGFDAEVEFERSDAPGWFRIYVFSNHFERFLESERQDILWRVIKERWDREDQLRVSLTLVFTKREWRGNGAAPRSSRPRRRRRAATSAR
jgi:hypothetical protein